VPHKKREGVKKAVRGRKSRSRRPGRQEDGPLAAWGEGGVWRIAPLGVAGLGSLREEEKGDAQPEFHGQKLRAKEKRKVFWGIGKVEARFCSSLTLKIRGRSKGFKSNHKRKT